MTRAWMGNVRELRNVLERACILADGEVLIERDLLAALPLETVAPHAERHGPVRKSRGVQLSEDLHLVEREHVVRVLAEAHGDQRARRCAWAEPPHSVPPARTLQPDGRLRPARGLNGRGRPDGRPWTTL